LKWSQLRRNNFEFIKKLAYPLIGRPHIRGSAVSTGYRKCLLRAWLICLPPVEMLIYRKNSFSFDEYYCFDGDDDYLLQLRRSWENKLREAIAALPCLSKEAVKIMRVDL